MDESGQECEQTHTNSARHAIGNLYYERPGFYTGVTKRSRDPECLYKVFMVPDRHFLPILHKQRIYF